jgi:SAM-dependent methyltransferase
MMLGKAYARLISVDTESRAVVAAIGAAVRASPGLVVDVGCGYGRYLRLLVAQGMDTLGVEVNPVIVEKNNAAGLRCMTPEQFDASGKRANVLLMAHLIEHFAPRDLLAFLDRWLDRLETGGELVIVTPLESPHFYDDFDHVKPYHPEGLQMVFGGAAQVQYWSKHRLELVDVVFRRSPWRATLTRALYRGGPGAWPWYLANALAAVAFRLSFGLLGRKTGWIGRFRKR